MPRCFPAPPGEGATAGGGDSPAARRGGSGLPRCSPPLCNPARHSPLYGGGGAFAVGAAVEFGFTLLLDAISQPSKTFAMLRLAFGARAGWLAQNRENRGVGWGEAARMFWPHTLFGIAVFALLASSSWV